MGEERVTHMRAADLLGEGVPTAPAPRRGLGRRRQAAGIALMVLGLPLLTLALEQGRQTLSLESDLLLYMLAVVVIALVGGVVTALLSAVFAAGMINWFFIQPLHTLSVSRAEELFALIVFLVAAGAISGAVEIAGRRARAAAQAAAQAETLSSLAGADLQATETLRELLDRARRTFGMESVALRSREGPIEGWADVERVGFERPGHEAPLRFDIPIGHDLRLMGRGPALFASDQRVLRAFAAAAETAYRGRRLNEEAQEARNLADVDRQRTALLSAVGHDLRTPLAGVKAAVSSLRQSDVSLAEEERAELLETIEQSADRLDAVVTNLLDASRLEAGSLTVSAAPVALDEVVAKALLALPESEGRVRLDVPEDVPPVFADPGLLERVIVNLVENSLRHGGEGEPVEIRAVAGETSAKLLIVDHGPGMAVGQRERMFAPFQRLDDRSTSTGVGLGLAVARGFTEAMGGVLVADPSDDGLTMRLRLPLARTGGGGAVEAEPGEEAEGAKEPA